MKNVALFDNQEIWPAWLIALAVLIFGWLAAIVLRIFIAKLLERFGFNRFCERVRLSDFLQKGRVFYSPASLVAAIVYWVLLLGVLFCSARILNLRMAANIFERLQTAAPSFVAALLMLVLGLMIVSFIGNFVLTLARNAGFPHARMVSQITKAAGIIIVVSLTLEQANIATTMIATLFNIVFGAAALGLALAFGLGCKDMAREVMEQFLFKLRERSRAEKSSDMEG